MRRKIATLSASSVVIALALALIPAAAHAEPHYYRNNTLLGSEPVPTVGWGTLQFVGIIADFRAQCDTVIAGSVENPEGGGAGTGETESFDTYDCELNECPTELGLHAAVLAESLPWPNLLELEGPTVRQKANGMKLTVECLEGNAILGSAGYVGSLQPRFRNGTSALHAGFTEYDAKAGELKNENGPGGILKLEGKPKVIGYEEQEVINAKTT